MATTKRRVRYTVRCRRCTAVCADLRAACIFILGLTATVFAFGAANWFLAAQWSAVHPAPKDERVTPSEIVPGNSLAPSPRLGHEQVHSTPHFGIWIGL
jgi:hypothetical protein